MSEEQGDVMLATARGIQADVTKIISEIASWGERLRRLDYLFSAFRTDYQNAQA